MMAPLFGDITPDAVAYQCVIAGCRPAELPVVLAATEAILEPGFNLLGVATTTGTPAWRYASMARSPRTLGMNAGTNCLGPGQPRQCQHRACAAALPAQHRRRARRDRRHGDHGAAGGKYTFCFAERSDGPFPTLTERRGPGRRHQRPSP